MDSHPHDKSSTEERGGRKQSSSTRNSTTETQAPETQAIPQLKENGGTGTRAQGQAEARGRPNSRNNIWMFPNQPQVLIDPATGAHYYSAEPQSQGQYSMEFTLGPPTAVTPAQVPSTVPAAPAGFPIPTNSTALPTGHPNYPAASFDPGNPNLLFVALRARAIEVIVYRYLLEFKDASPLGKIIIRRIVEENVEQDKERFEALVNGGTKDEQWWAYAEERMWGGRTRMV